MSDPLIRECDYFLVLEPSKPERILSQEETLAWLQYWLETLDDLPDDLKALENRAKAARHLLDTACDLDLSPGFTLKWFAVRLAPPRP